MITLKRKKEYNNVKTNNCRVSTFNDAIIMIIHDNKLTVSYNNNSTDIYHKSNHIVSFPNSCMIEYATIDNYFIEFSKPTSQTTKIKVEFDNLMNVTFLISKNAVYIS